MTYQKKSDIRGQKTQKYGRIDEEDISGGILTDVSVILMREGDN